MPDLSGTTLANKETDRGKTVIDAFLTAATDLWNVAFGSGSRLWPLYLLTTIVIGYGLFRYRRVQGSFLSWLAPSSVWTHASHIVDIKLFAVSKILSVLGIFPTVAIAAFVTSLITSGLVPDTSQPASLSPVLAAALLLVVGDFATYWVHRIHHEMRILWPFHAVHHSAEVMTPITVYRKHPVYDLTKTLVHGLFLGVFQGLLIKAFPGSISLATLMGVNAGYFLFNMLGANFRHTHIWLGYGPVLEHILISPAQHQIHHSIAPEHHNKNYGEVLAIWDWMFGSLYVASKTETIEFGLGDSQGNRLRQRHDSLSSALVVPVKDSLKQVRKLASRKRGKANPVTPAE